MKTFWVTAKKSPSSQSKPIRPKSPIFVSRSARNNGVAETWPRHRSVPVVSTPYASSISRVKLSPEKWPQLDESMAVPVGTSGNQNLNSFIPLSTSSNNQGIEIEETKLIQQLSSVPNTAPLLELQFVAKGNIKKFAQLAEENAQRSRQLADWAKKLEEAVEIQHSALEESDTNVSLENVATLERSTSSLGSSVDRDFLQATPNQERKYCIVS